MIQDGKWKVFEGLSEMKLTDYRKIWYLDYRFFRGCQFYDYAFLWCNLNFTLHINTIAMAEVMSLSWATSFLSPGKDDAVVAVPKKNHYPEFSRSVQACTLYTVQACTLYTERNL